MTNPNYTHISLVVDRSGSMTHLAADATGAINNFIDEQKKVPGKCTVTLAEFDDFHNVWFQGDIDDITPYTLTPRGWTALNDAMGRTIASTGQFLDAMPEDERPAHVIFFIVTDGAENASKEYTLEQVRKMVTEQQDVYKWHFQFMAANIDAFATSQAYNTRGSTQSVATRQSYLGTYAAAGQSTTALRTGATKDFKMPTDIDADGNVTTP